MVSLTLRGLFARKLRAFLTALAVLLGVMMISGTYVFTDTINKSFEGIFETANKWLHALTGGGAKADLRVFVNDGHQEYLVAVPEPATVILLGLGGLAGVFGRRRRRIVSEQA